MITRIPLSYPSPAVAAGGADDHRPVSCRRFATFLPPLLVAGFVAGISPAALADPPPAPSENHVWAGCALTTGTNGAVAKLQASLDPSGPSGLNAPPYEIDFVLVYSRANDNDGQQFGAGTTGPILCINPNTVAIETTGENTPIPGGTDTVDITALESALILQYEKAGIREKRICHTAADNTDCFLIKPAP
ncbi:MAG: hypothetical protein ACREVK_11645 [Gammaproteobacteria bacterium]